MIPIEKVELAPGLTIPRVVTGLWQIADLERGGAPVNPVAAAAALEEYRAEGFTAFDLADHYGSAEDLVGAFRARIPGAAGALFFTKWVPRPGPVTRQEVRAAVERALRRMGGTAIDLLQYHAWSYPDPSWLDALFHLGELAREGLIRQIGVTNFDTTHLRIALASGIPIVANQVSYSVIDRRAGGRMAALCAERGLKLLAYGTLAGGWLAEKWLGQPEPAWRTDGTWSQMKYGRFIETAGGWGAFQQVLAALDRVARRNGVSIANVATRFVLDQPAVAAVIIGARLGVSEHRTENRRVFGFQLAAEDRAQIDAAAASLTPIPGDTGDEYRKPPFLTASGDLSHHLDDVPAPYPAESAGPGRSRCLSGTPWESLAGFSRAVRIGGRILVSGTTATHRDRLIGGTDPAAQTHFVIDKIEGALQSLGGRLDQVIRTRVYVAQLAHWDAVARAHGERFAGIQPANTLVRADLVGEGYLVEIEAEAEVGG